MLEFLKNIPLIETDIPALEALRQKGRCAFAGLPNSKTEAYKYTPVKIALTPEMFQKAEHTCEKQYCTCGQDDLPIEGYAFHFCEGVGHTHFHFTDGLEILSLTEAIATHEAAKFINKFDLENFPFAALNTAFLDEGVFLRVSKNLDRPIVFIYKGKENGFRNIRNLIVIEKGVKAEFIEIFEGSGASYFTNIVSEIFISKQASLSHYKMQTEGQNAVHIALSNVEVKEKGKYESFTFLKGAKLCRNETHVILKEEGAEAKVNAAYHLSSVRHSDITTNIEHLSAATKSNQVIRGVIEDEAHGVFQGKIHIAPDAKTEGYQIHKALLLSDDAKVDVKPELEIFADDVKCSHGATSGDLNKEELFYLTSRGIDEKTAGQILTSAFLLTAFEDITNPKVKKLFEAF